MSANDVVLNQLSASQWLFENFTKDFSEEDARYQPGADGNHLNWILCHLAVTEDGITSAMSGQEKKLSSKLHSTYGPGSKCRADDGMTRGEAWKLFTETRARTMEFARQFDERRFNDPAPQGMPETLKTVGAVFSLLGMHPLWHFGQLSVNRRLLKKPALFGG